MNRVSFFSAFALALMLSIGNFWYQVFQGEPDFARAAERSFFQAIAIFLAWTMWRRPKPQPLEQGPGFYD